MTIRNEIHIPFEAVTGLFTIAKLPARVKQSVIWIELISRLRKNKRK